MNEYPFIITVCDGFCTWEYKIEFENSGKLCINDIIDAISDKHTVTKIETKIIEEDLWKKN